MSRTASRVSSSSSSSSMDDDYYPPEVPYYPPDVPQEEQEESEEEPLHPSASSSQPLPRAREHSYLPGASHPLWPEPTSPLLRRGPRRSQQQPNTTELLELPILELESVVLFPGATLPLRWNSETTLVGRRHSWLRQYLGRQIDASRNGGGMDHTATTAAAAGGQSSESAQAQQQPPQVRLGILTRPDDTESRASVVRARRQSWARRSLGPVRLRRLSQQFLQQLGAELNEPEEEPEEEEDVDEQDSVLAVRGNDEPEAAPVRALVVVENAHDSDQDEEMQEPAQPQPIRILLRRASSRSNASSTSSSQRPSDQNNGWMGRIGTIATVTYTHGDDLLATGSSGGGTTARGSGVWQSHSEEGELVVTALGTGRFRIVGENENSADRVRTFWVEELDDTPLSLPPLPLCQSLQSSRPTSVQSEESHEQRLLALSVVSPHPLFVCQMAWPWKLVAEIREALQRVPSFIGLWQSLDSLEEEEKLKLAEPVNFSFWMASNMPLKQNEKMKLLEMNSCLERLRFIRQKIADEEEAESAIFCKVCGIPLARASAMFSVEGAEGTTGAYVNEYGCIHQTITVRNVDETQIQLQGPAETRDSWFPGYAWIIAYCTCCDSHLGWKFEQVDSDGAASTGNTTVPTSRERPSEFYGLAAGSVETHVAYDSSSPQGRRRRREGR